MLKRKRRKQNLKRINTNRDIKVLLPNLMED
jgi:hypothetical protein